jgi:biotin synthase
MCYAIPGKVEIIEQKIVTVDYYGEKRKAINELDKLKVGDYVFAQGGYVIQIVPEAEAKSILEMWKELFWQLQETDVRLSSPGSETSSDRKLSKMLDKAMESRELDKEELLYLLHLQDEEGLSLLCKSGNFLRQKHLGNSCCVHGIIEFSNYCAQNCLYCGIAAGNSKVHRYRMSDEEIVGTAIQAIEAYGFKALVLQSGEDPEYPAPRIASIIREIKKSAAALIMVSPGEVGVEGLKELYEAGARGLLMRFETSNPALYEKIRPGNKLETRLSQLRAAYEMGYLVLTGSLIGIPGQMEEDILSDIMLAKSLHAEMFSFGPFIPHPDTPLGKHPLDSSRKILKTLAVSRIVDPENAKILVTTAFETLDKEAREKGLSAGANSVMLNITPYQYKKEYAIYPNRAHVEESIPDQIEKTLSLLKSLGRAPTDLGVNRDF